MHNFSLNRRRFIKNSAGAAAGITILSSLSQKAFSVPNHQPKIRFSVININHPHIYGMVDAVTRGGGQLISFYVKEADLAAAFAKKYPSARQVQHQKEILEDNSI